MTNVEQAQFISDVRKIRLRDLPWRHAEANGSFDPYKIWISEIMLQQTQVPRVVPKYEQFLMRFPDITHLANATFADVLREWSGLGYNRRAKYLLEGAKLIVKEWSGKLPKTVEQLKRLPGVGPNTAAAIAVYAHNQPAVFIETNIRTVYIHHFFQNKTGVHDDEILPLVAVTLDKQDPRTWYWKLMDYGTKIKAEQGNVARLSRHYVKQSRFKGSQRELRAAILRSLLKAKKTTQQLRQLHPDERLEIVLHSLVKEGLVTQENGYFQLA